MSFTKDKRETIKRYLLEKVNDGEAGFVRKTASTFGITTNTVYRYIRELLEDGVLCKDGRIYRLVSDTRFFALYPGNQTIHEDQIFSHDIRPLLAGLPENVVHIWEYGFTEMLNNVAEHACAKAADIYVARNYLNTSIVIADDGIGIFKKIKDAYGLEDLDDAILELFKGKLTTDKEHHSGEGIFFTSRVMDLFAAISGGKVFSHSEYSEVLKDMKEIPAFSDLSDGGTMIMMTLANNSGKVLSEVFDQYADVEGGFIRTRLPIKNIFPNAPVSRSQAKRLANRMDEFKEIELDFEGVKTIGQAFAHELFVVYQNRHPDIQLIPYNTTLEVQKMIYHVSRQVAQ